MIMFTTPCFIGKNTSELRKYLESIGYTENTADIFGWGNSFEYDCIATNNNMYALCDFDQINFDGNYERVDCKENEGLFKAISALRDDSDYMQWFTDGTNWEYCIEDKFSMHDLNQCEGMCELDLLLRHKASLCEIFKHFNE